MQRFVILHVSLTGLANSSFVPACRVYSSSRCFLSPRVQVTIFIFLKLKTVTSPRSPEFLLRTLSLMSIYSSRKLTWKFHWLDCSTVRKSWALDISDIWHADKLFPLIQHCKLCQRRIDRRDYSFTVLEFLSTSWHCVRSLLSWYCYSMSIMQHLESPVSQMELSK